MRYLRRMVLARRKREERKKIKNKITIILTFNNHLFICLFVFSLDRNIPYSCIQHTDVPIRGFLFETQ